MVLIGNQIGHALILCLWIVAYLAIPCLTFIAYRGWARRGRQVLPSWRSYLGVGSMSLTLIVWLGTVYFAFSHYAHLPTNFFSDTWMAANMLISMLAVAGSFALKGRPRMSAFAAAALMTAPWIFDYFRGA